MGILIGQLEFLGPEKDPAQFSDGPGLYAILAEASNDEYELIDLGESGSIRESLLSAESIATVGDDLLGTLRFAAHYAPDLEPAERVALKEELLREFDTKAESEFVACVS